MSVETAASADPSLLAARFRLCGFGPVFLTSRLNLLLVAVPLAFLARFGDASQAWVFVWSLLGLVPLAASMGFLTEELAEHTSQTVGGLLNATMGNATELIISVAALRSGLLRVIQLSLLGSILSNLLLVLGTAFFVGGLRHHEQRFSRDLAVSNGGMLMVVCMALSFPAVLHLSDAETESSELAFSHFTALVLLAMYVAYLVFQLRTHTDLFEDAESEAGGGGGPGVELSLREAAAWLALVTVLVAVLSEFLVSTFVDASHALGVPQAFNAAIVLPIIGNAAEHATAVTAAARNKMNLSLAVAVGSSTQIAAFGVPFMVVAAWVAGRPLSLYFRAYETATLLMATLLAMALTSGGRSNWLSGLMLVGAYTVVGAGFFFHRDDDDGGGGSGQE